MLLIQDGGPKVDLRNALKIDAAQHGLVADTTDPHRLDRLGRYFQNMDRVVVSCHFELSPDFRATFRSLGAVRIAREFSRPECPAEIAPPDDVGG